MDTKINSKAGLWSRLTVLPPKSNRSTKWGTLNKHAPMIRYNKNPCDRYLSDTCIIKPFVKSLAELPVYTFVSSEHPAESIFPCHLRLLCCLVCQHGHVFSSDQVLLSGVQAFVNTFSTAPEPTASPISITSFQWSSNATSQNSIPRRSPGIKLSNNTFENW